MSAHPEAGNSRNTVSLSPGKKLGSPEKELEFFKKYITISGTNIRLAAQNGYPIRLNSILRPSMKSSQLIYIDPNLLNPRNTNPLHRAMSPQVIGLADNETDAIQSFRHVMGSLKNQIDAQPSARKALPAPEATETSNENDFENPDNCLTFDSPMVVGFSLPDSDN